jgi:hypothetical protein
LGRIHALTAAYALLSREGWSQIPLREIPDAGIAAVYVRRAGEYLGGRAAGLAATARRAGPGDGGARIDHERSQYGALSVAEGNVEVAWDVKTGVGLDQLVLTWVERNGPPVTPPEHRGFGMTLIERAFAHDVGGAARVCFQPEGVVATLRAPLPGKTNKGPS